MALSRLTTIGQEFVDEEAVEGVGFLDVDEVRRSRPAARGGIYFIRVRGTGVAASETVVRLD